MISPYAFANPGQAHRGASARTGHSGAGGVADEACMGVAPAKSWRRHHEQGQPAPSLALCLRYALVSPGRDRRCSRMLHKSQPMRDDGDPGVEIECHPGCRRKPPILLLGPIGLLLVVLLWLLLSPRAVPNDDQLRNHFTAHKAAFVKMRDMLVAEPVLVDVGPDGLIGRTPPNPNYTSLTKGYSRKDGQWATKGSDHRERVVSEAEALAAVGLSSDRYQEYLKLLGIARATSLGWIPWQESQEVQVTISSAGLAPSGQTKSIDYFPNGIPRWYVVVDNTDAARGPKGNWYSPLGDGWYIHRYCW
jgi:hypothetical protein